MAGVDGTGWQPVETDEEDVVSGRALGALYDLLDDGNPAPFPGASVPILWHWLAFLPRAAQHELGPDGHPRRGGFLPPVDLPRRMIAGGKVLLHAGLAAGQPLRRRAKVASVEEKRGRSGRFVLVTVRYEIEPALTGGPGLPDGPALPGRPALPGGAALPEDASPRAAPLLVEEQHIAYREAHDRVLQAAANPAPAGGARAAPEDGPGSSRWSLSWDLAIEPALLFRFSALTYNAHRIHYDRAWATGVEGYPGLVVHGPLQAVALAELCRRHVPERTVQLFEFRATSPKFDDGPLLLRGAPEARAGTERAGGATGPDAVELVAFDGRGTVTMRARAVWAAG